MDAAPTARKPGAPLRSEVAALRKYVKLFAVYEDDSRNNEPLSVVHKDLHEIVTHQLEFRNQDPHDIERSPLQVDYLEKVKAWFQPRIVAADDGIDAGYLEIDLNGAEIIDRRLRQRERGEGEKRDRPAQYDYLIMWPLDRAKQSVWVPRTFLQISDARIKQFDGTVSTRMFHLKQPPMASHTMPAQSVGSARRNLEVCPRVLVEGRACTSSRQLGWACDATIGCAGIWSSCESRRSA